MRAKDYYEKYKASEWNNATIDEYIKELNAEAKALTKTRHAERLESLAAIISEINNKHNAHMRLFRKRDGTQPLITDMYVLFWMDKMPEFKPYFSSLRSIEDIQKETVESLTIKVSEDALFFYTHITEKELVDGVKEQYHGIYNSETGEQIFRTANRIQAIDMGTKYSSLPSYAAIPYYAANKIYTMLEGREYKMDLPAFRHLCTQLEDVDILLGLNLLCQYGLATHNAQEDKLYISPWPISDAANN